MHHGGSCATDIGRHGATGPQRESLVFPRHVTVALATAVVMPLVVHQWRDFGSLRRRISEKDVAWTLTDRNLSKN